jgi:hypothetical protein
MHETSSQLLLVRTGSATVNKSVPFRLFYCCLAVTDSERFVLIDSGRNELGFLVGCEVNSGTMGPALAVHPSNTYASM